MNIGCFIGFTKVVPKKNWNDDEEEIPNSNWSKY